MTDFLNESPSVDALVTAASEGFVSTWGASPTHAAIAPGRVNVIGEHVDYNGGWVLPAAIERYIVFAVRARPDRHVRLASAMVKGTIEFSLDALAPGTDLNWGRYVKGVLAGLAAAGETLTGFDAYLLSSVPVGGGLSSSAALEAVVGLASLALNGRSMDPFALAKLCQTAEHDYAGVPCGIMDQAAVLTCQKDHLLFLDCETETATLARFDGPDWGLMIINSGVAHELASGEYGARRAACHTAAELLGVPSLRHLPLESLEAHLAHPGLSEEMQRCVRHNVTENDRTHRMVAALGEGDFVTAGHLLNASHASLRDDYRVSCSELDFIAERAQFERAVAGCRMTGGGFGGSAIALVRKEAAAAIAAAIGEAYFEAFSMRPGIFLTSPAAGGHVRVLA